MIKTIFLSLFLATSLFGDPRFYLPEEHELRVTLDEIFADSTVLDNQTAVDKAGFKTLYAQSSGMRVLRHPLLDGYLIKAFLKDEKRRTNTDLEWMKKRCLGAENIRNLIRDEKLRYFTVPDKWIYFVPEKDRAVLVVTDMNLVSKAESVEAWRTKITRKHLRELHSILSHGFASLYLPYNIPYTKDGTFACVDTAYPYRRFRLEKVRSKLSEKMQEYWNELYHLTWIN